MNSLFNTRRFTTLLQNHFIERSRTYFWFFLACTLLYFVVSALIFMLGGKEIFNYDGQRFSFFFALFITGSVFSARYHESLGKKSSQIVMLMQPASTFEKWLCILFVVLLFYPIVYTVLYCSCSLLTSSLAALLDPESAPHNYRVFIPFITTDTHETFYSALYHSLIAFWIYGLLQGIIHSLTLYFKRLVNIKILVSLVLLALLTLFLLGLQPTLDPFYLLPFYGDPPYTTSWTHAIFNVLFWLGVPALIWLSAYFNLKHREIT